MKFFDGGVRTGCKEKRAGRAKFAAFSFTNWARCSRRHRRLRRCSRDLSMCVNGLESEHGFRKTTPAICSLRDILVCYPRFGPLLNDLLNPFLGKPTFGWRRKKIPLL